MIRNWRQLQREQKARLSNSTMFLTMWLNSKMKVAIPLLGWTQSALPVKILGVSSNVLYNLNCNLKNDEIVENGTKATHYTLPYRLVLTLLCLNHFCSLKTVDLRPILFIAMHRHFIFNLLLSKHKNSNETLKMGLS